MIKHSNGSVLLIQSPKDQAIKSLKYYLLISLIFSIMGLVQSLPSAYGVGSIFGFSGRKLLLLSPHFFSLSLALMGWILLGTRHAKYVINFGRQVVYMIKRLRSLNWVFWAASILMFGLCVLLDLFNSFLTLFPLIWLFGQIVLLGVLFIYGTGRYTLVQSMLVTFSVYGVILWLIYYLPNINNFPLTLSWSETSHYYYASLIFSRIIYGQRAPLSILNPSRYLLQSLPFLVPSLPLLFHRLWEVMLWLGISFASAVALSNRVKPADKLLKLALTAWFFMFCFQGPIYYQLMLVVLIVLLGFKKDRFWFSIGCVAVASLWAGISRVNWFPVAGMLAVTLYVLEVPYEDKSFWHYWGWPITAVILGMILAFGSSVVYTVISGQNPETFTLSFGMPLLGYRLLPSEAYGLGIIILTAIASLPALLIILWRVLPRARQWHSLRLLALLSVVISLIVAGLVVSARIGGGNNIHNLDSFLVILGVITVYVAFNRFTPDKPDDNQIKSLPMPIVLLAFLIPLVSTINVLRPFSKLDRQQAWADLQQVQDLIDNAQNENGEILFIHQRHLLIFNLIDNVDMVHEYEKVELMEMAMANNQTYLKKFLDDLQNQRFDLIITEPILIIIRPSTDIFAEENNAWVEHVSIPLLESYEIISEMRESNMVVLAPKGWD